NDKLVTAVWIGYPEGQSRPLLNVEGVTKVAGGTLPAFIFKKFMTKAAPSDGKPAPDPILDVRALNGSSASASGARSSIAASDSSATTTTVADAPAPTTTAGPVTPVITIPAPKP